LVAESIAGASPVLAFDQANIASADRASKASSSALAAAALVKLSFSRPLAACKLAMREAILVR
jgi:hypothetical protein